MDHSIDAPNVIPAGAHAYQTLPVASDATRDVAAQFEAMLFKEAFAPLAKAMGFYGDSVVAAAAQSMTRGAGSALTDPLASAMDAAARDGIVR